MMRLQKYIADCGAASRRVAESLILDGRVSVNGAIVQTMGVKVAGCDTVAVDGKIIRPVTQKIYIMLNKPTGVVSSAKDPFGRKTVVGLVVGKGRLFSVGRLDFDTSGLILLTNDGDFAYTLTHPKNRVKKTYVAVVDGTPSKADVSRLEKGVFVDGRQTAPAQVRVLGRENGNAQVSVTIWEGRNRQVRKMFAAVGLNVLSLQRLSIGALQLADLPLGQWRELTKEEVDMLLRPRGSAPNPAGAVGPGPH